MNEHANTVENDGQLAGMTPSLRLCLEAVGDSVVVSYGGRALALYERSDQGMRNLAIVSLTRAGVPGVEVAALFGIRPEHVSRLRRHAAEGGARALLPPRGRPSKVDARALARAYEMSDQGVSGSAIAQALGVSEATISRLLARRPGRGVERLPVSEPGEVSGPADVTDTGEVTVADIAATAQMTEVDVPVAEASEPVEMAEGGGAPARIGEGSWRSVYASAMLLHPFLEKVGAGGLLSVLDSGRSRSYDTTTVALAATFAFALGCSSLEGSKHLQLADAGPLVGARECRRNRVRLVERI